MEWNREWGNSVANKLREMKENMKARRVEENRYWDVRLTRLRIGHTRHTHAYLMSERAMSYCDSCIVSLSIERILVECPDYNKKRRDIYKKKSHNNEEYLNN